MLNNINKAKMPSLLYLIQSTELTTVNLFENSIFLGLCYVYSL